MENEKTILIVDDSPADLQLVMNVVKENYKVLASTAGAQAIEIVKTYKPSLVILDVSMPIMDGYVTCQKIKEVNSETLVIFLSANDTTEEILKGYEAGGSDYIVKPFDPNVLLNKINSAYQNHEREQDLKKEIDYASKVALAAISSSSELSIIVQFLRASFHAESIEELAKLACESLSDYNLLGSMQLRLTGTTLEVSPTGAVSNLEAELLNRIAVMEERIYENKSRLFINFNHASLLIKNIPLEDADKTGRLRDYLMLLVEGLNEKLEWFEAQQNASSNRETSKSALAENVKTSLDYIHQSRKEIEQANIKILDKLADELEDTFIGLELSGEQESQILELVKDAQEASEAVFQRGAEIDLAMQEVLAKVSQLET